MSDPEATTPAAPGPLRGEPDGSNPVDRRGMAEDTHLATSALAYLLSGPLTFGGLGWLTDWWLGTQVFVVIGLMLGMAMSIYVIWLRYGTP